MVDFGGVVTNITSGAPGAIRLLIVGVVALVLVVLVLGGVFWWWYKNKRWNLKVEIKLTRADGAITYGEWGKGAYDPKRGVVLIKRPYKGSKPIPMKIFDTRKYMQGPDLITVIQVGPEDFRPVLNKSWSEQNVEYEDTTKPLKDEEGNLLLDEEGNQKYEIVTVKEAIMNISIDPGLDKAWKVSWDAAAKKAYSIQTFLAQFQTPIAIGIVMICCFVGFAILWSKI